MNNIEELLDKLPQVIVVNEKKYEFSLQKTYGDGFPELKYIAQYWNLNKQDDDTFFPAKVLVTEEDGAKGYVYAISVGKTVEEVVTDLLSRVKDYIKTE